MKQTLYSIIVNQLSKESETKGFKILSDIQFTVKTGEVFGILGENGSGKTTLIECLLGLSIINAGEIILCNKIQKFGKNTIKGLSAYYVSSESEVFEYLTGIENIQFNCELYKNKVSNEEIVKNLKKFHIFDHKNKLVKDYSKGMKQRLILCMMELVNPDLIFLDEPTTGLDYLALDLLESTIKEFKKRKKTIVIATHDIKFAFSTFDKWLLMENGKIKTSGINNELSGLVEMWSINKEF